MQHHPSPARRVRRPLAAVVGLALVVAGLVACDETPSGDDDGGGRSRHRHLLGLEQPDLDPGQRHRPAGHGQRRQAQDRLPLVPGRHVGHHDRHGPALVPAPPDGLRPLGAERRRRSPSNTTHQTRPALGTRVGTVKQTTAGTRVSIPLSNVKVTRGRVYLAITTTSPYELEITSSEGAAAAKATSTAPAFTLQGTTSTDAHHHAAGDAAHDPARPPAAGAWRGPTSSTARPSTPPSGTSTTRPGRGAASSRPRPPPAPRPRTCRSASGILVMRTQKANGACRGGQAQSGAGLNTWGKFQQAQGRFEARVRWTPPATTCGAASGPTATAVPATTGRWGPSSTSSSTSARTPSPTSAASSPPSTSTTRATRSACRTSPYNGHDVTDWHTYAVEWEPAVAGDPTSTQIKFFLDGTPDRPVRQGRGVGGEPERHAGCSCTRGRGPTTTVPFPTPFGPDRAHKIILSAWVGAPSVDAATVARGYAPAGGHADLQVDWVRVYQR